MSNHLAVDKAHSIQHLHELGWSQRKIAQTLAIDRKSVKRHLESLNSKGTAPTGEAATAPDCVADDSKGASAPTAQAVMEAAGIEQPVTPTVSARSGCVAYHDAILAGLEQRLTAQRIYQDLVVDHGFRGSYWSVNPYVKHLHTRTQIPFRRMETAPGEEAQIDFGTGAPIIDSDGKKRRTHVLRVVLSHSRKAYSEVVLRQTTEWFITAIENAFHTFGCRVRSGTEPVLRFGWGGWRLVDCDY